MMATMMSTVKAVTTWLILLVMISGGIFYFRHALSHKVQPAMVQPTEEEKALINKAHKYHGIWWSVQDETGWYFYQDGKRCEINLWKTHRTGEEVKKETRANKTRSTVFGKNFRRHVSPSNTKRLSWYKS